MGCVASKLEEGEVVSICRERKRLLKLAVERRYGLAEAHCNYYRSLYGVSLAIKFFVACHSSPSTPFLITFQPNCPPPPKPTESVITKPILLQQESIFESEITTTTTHEANDCGLCASSTSTSDSEEEGKEELVSRQKEEQQEACGYFYMQMPPPMPSPQREFGWDFFNPFDNVRPEVVSGFRRSLDDDLRVVREQEGIPELEEEGIGEEIENEVVVVEDNCDNNKSGFEMVKGDNVCISQVEQNGLIVDAPFVEGRELLEALKDIEDHFNRAYESGNDLSNMLEANCLQMQSSLEEIKENSRKLNKSITLHRSTPLKPYSCKSLVASSSKISTMTEYKNDLFDNYGGMSSGSHSLTLERLYAWEKKLYEEVKAGDSTRKLYEKKCSRLRNQDIRGDDDIFVDKTRVVIKDLYARILVAIQSAESISKRIQILRDEELQPQIVELLKGLLQTWKIMLQTHETQYKILFEVKYFTCPTYGKFCNETHRIATLQLQAELHNWHTCFMNYVTAQKTYVEALHGWLIKFLVPEVEFCSRNKASAAPYRANGPPLLVICHDWLASMEKLPEKAVTFALKSFGKDVNALWIQQGEEQKQKRKVDGLAKELERRTLGLQKIEGRFLEYSKPTEEKPESNVESQNEFLMEKNDQLETLRRRLDVEKENHQNCMKETQRITLNGFQTGFCAVFESLTEFAKASQNMYNDLVTFSDNAEKDGNLSYMEGTKDEHISYR